MKRLAGLLILIMLTFLSGCFLDKKGKEGITLDGPSKVAIGEVIQLDANTEESILWSSSNEAVAIVMNGFVFGLSEGRTMITATLENNPEVTKSKLITVFKNTEPTEQAIIITGVHEIELNSSTTLKANSNVPIKWVSSNPEIATVDENGKVTAVSVGSTMIFVHEEDNILNYGTFEIKVVEKKLTIIGPNEIHLRDEYQLKVEDGVKVVWLSSDDRIITVDYSGKIKGVNIGVATISAYNIYNREVSGSVTIQVLPPAKGIDTSYSYTRTKILSINEDQYEMELLGVDTKYYTADTKVSKLKDGVTSEISIEDLYIGMDNVYVEVGEDSKTISQILVDGDTKFSNIRVAIRRVITNIADDSTIYHDRVTFRTKSNTTIRTYDGLSTLSVGANTNITIMVSSSNLIQVRIGSSYATALATSKRLIINSENNDEITFTSITRNGRNPSYADNLEVSLVNNKLLVINDINLEKYLTKVVPSEMPTSWNIEALKSQAIAARTYAYMDILNKSHDAYGYTVDDSEKSQVYNNSDPQTSSTTAVNATKGIIMTSGGNLVQAYYYSSSSGLTASGHEVWIKDGNIGSPINYLIGKNLTKDTSGKPISFDPTSEASMLQFFKTIKMYTPDSNSAYHRWKVTMTYDQLSTTINTNLKLTYASTPQLVLTKDGNNWVSKAIPDSIGKVTDLFVSQRGTSGVVISIDIVTTSGTYRVINQYNIRFTIRPKDAGSTVTRNSARNTDSNYTSSSTNDSILLSGFFAIEKANNGVVFYGGGNGHGVGMSQYGANGLAQSGYDYVYILNTYYSNLEFVDITNTYTPLKNFEQYFK